MKKPLLFLLALPSLACATDNDYAAHLPGTISDSDIIMFENSAHTAYYYVTASAIKAYTAYALPTATTSALGGVKVDGSTITISGGVISAPYTYTLPTATTSVLGGVKVDGSTITSSSGVISATAYALPTATTSVLGGVKVDGTTVTISGGIISAPYTYTLPQATNSTLGGVTVDGTTITASGGVISAPYTYTLPTATTSVLGGVKVDGSTITISGGVISAASTYTLPTATTSVLGGVKVDGTTITISSGVISTGTSVVTTTGTQTLTGKTLTSPTLTAPVLGTPASGNLANCTFPVATTSALGAVKVDGTSITISSGVISAGTPGYALISTGSSTLSGSGTYYFDYHVGTTTTTLPTSPAEGTCVTIFDIYGTSTEFGSKGFSAVNETVAGPTNDIAAPGGNVSSVTLNRNYQVATFIYTLVGGSGYWVFKEAHPPTVITGTLSSGSGTQTVPSGVTPVVTDTASTPNAISVTVSGTTATIHGTGTDTYTLYIP